MSDHIKSPVLINAAEMARNHPTTFSRPDIGELQRVNLFDFCKVAFPVKGALFGKPTIGERFWVEVVEKKFPFFVGRIDNDLLTHQLSCDDLIRFHVDNVYEVLPCIKAFEKFHGNHPPPNA